MAALMMTDVPIMIDKIRAMAALEDDWDSYGAPPPSALVIEKAIEALCALTAAGLAPRYAVPHAEGGVALIFTAINGRGVADVECFNDGEMLAGTWGRAWNDSSVWAVTDYADTAARIREHKDSVT